MPVEKGSAFLLKVGNGAAPVVYATVAGLRTTQLSINGESVVITNKGSGGWRELLSGATDQLLGTGDGVRTRFALVKRYGTGADAEVRPITRPVPVSVQVAVGGVEVVSGWTLGAGGVVDFAVAPGVSATVTAGYLFDVPVRFAEDRLGVSLATFMAGEVGEVALVEVRE